MLIPAAKRLAVVSQKHLMIFHFLVECGQISALAQRIAATVNHAVFELHRQRENFRRFCFNKIKELKNVIKKI